MGTKYAAYRLVQWGSTHLSRPSAFRLAERVADLQWRRASGVRTSVQANLSMVLGTPIPYESPLVREVFRNFGRYLVEFFTSHQVDRPQITVEGDAHLKTAKQRARGVIVLTAHLGNWELGAVTIHRMGLPITAIALPHGDPQLDQLFNYQRQRCGITVVPLGTEAARRSLESLRRGQLLGLLGDRDFTENGITVSFCGRDVTLPRGPATLSLRSQAPVVPTFFIREGLWKFRLCFEPPIWPQVGEVKEAAAQALTQTYAAILERYLKRFPEQWLIFQLLT